MANKKPKPRKPLEAVEIVWNDACGKMEEILGPDLTDYTPGVINREFGHYIGEKDGFIMIATEKSDSGTEQPYRGVIDIPCSIVNEIWRLERTEKIWGRSENLKPARRGTRTKASRTTKVSSLR